MDWYGCHSCVGMVALLKHWSPICLCRCGDRQVTTEAFQLSNFILNKSNHARQMSKFIIITIEMRIALAGTLKLRTMKINFI